MKTSLKLIASALLLAATVAVASPGVDPNGQPQKKAFSAVMYPAAGSSKVWLALEKTLPEFKVNVELLDQKGNVLFRETLPARGSKRNNAFSQSFDLSAVKDGNYTFRIYTAGFQNEEFTFNLSTPTVTEKPARLISIK